MAVATALEELLQDELVVQLDAEEGLGRRVAGRVCVLEEADGGGGAAEAGGVEDLGASEGDVAREGGDAGESVQRVEDGGELSDAFAGENDDCGAVHGCWWEGSWVEEEAVVLEEAVVSGCWCGCCWLIGCYSCCWLIGCHSCWWLIGCHSCR